MKHVLRILSALLVLLSLVGLFSVTASAVNLGRFCFLRN